MSVNLSILIGNVGQDPQAMGSGCRLSLATTESYKDKEGNQKKDTTWHTIKCWGKLADFATKYVTKGMPLYVEGRIENTTDEKSGKFYTAIVARKVQFVAPKERQKDNPGQPDERGW